MSSEIAAHAFSTCVRAANVISFLQYTSFTAPSIGKSADVKLSCYSKVLAQFDKTRRPVFLSWNVCSIRLILDVSILLVNNWNIMDACSLIEM